MKDMPESSAPPKFTDPDHTADGSKRARVCMSGLKTLWFNTGTLCNIECATCYIASSPTNDALLYLTAAEVTRYLDEIEAENFPVTEIGFTGGEPFMNPEILEILEAALSRGYDVLVLTNAMRPMLRPRTMAGLIGLEERFGAKLVLRISVDHHRSAEHDAERGLGSFAQTLEGMRWLAGAGLKMAVAGRSKWGESDAQARAGFARLFAREGFDIDAHDPAATVIFPEMDETADVPEITTECWGILGKSPEEVMCSSSRMVVHRKGEESPTVAACTLLPYQPEFDLGPTLKGAMREVALNHPHCAKFCVLGGASCSA
ncbi:radical SAM protein [Chachezhania antarctica]|uniref:radical SAM protein n=1 Tax=Chachezhania antarctica TaxID=2340860 RepID=UPI000EB13FFC|nr:radical SAM protein [Chachezhania antarctica]